MNSLSASALILALATGCSTTSASAEATTPDALRGTIDKLYSAFSFEPGQPADYAAMRSLFAPGAAFVSPGAGRAVDAEGFLEDFRNWLEGPVGATGLRERVLHVRSQHLGNIAHAWITFEGVLPETGERHSLGVDSVQFLNHEGAWRLVSFTTHYVADENELPATRLSGD